MNGHQEQGRAAYKRGDYKEAVRHFDRAISRAPSVQLLDNRAACYVKLDQLSDALKDAKATIHLQREDATGYLRAGKILCKMEKPAVALEIYAHGLKCVKHIGLGYELLRTAHKDLQDTLSPPRSQDPLTVLPPEMAEMIFEYLSFRQRINTCRVSKQWARYIRSNPNFWRHLDLSGARRQVRTSFISRAINSGRNSLKHATVQNLFEIEKALSALTKHCPIERLEVGDINITNLELVAILRQSKTLTWLSISPNRVVKDESLQQLLDTVVPKLQHLSCKANLFAGFSMQCPALRSLSLKLDPKSFAFLPNLLGDIPTLMPGIETLALESECYGARWMDLDLRACSKLRELSINFFRGRIREVSLPPSVVKLTFGNGFLLNPQGWYGADEPWMPYLPHLEEVSLSVYTFSPPCALQQLLDKSIHQSQMSSRATTGEHEARLASLSLRVDLSGVGPPGLNDTMRQVNPALLEADDIYRKLLDQPRLRSLEHLSLADSHAFEDADLEVVLKLLPKLTSLDISRTAVTGVGVKAVVLTARMKKLDISFCTQVSRDAVDWARSQGVTVTYRMAKVESGGKKVRY